MTWTEAHATVLPKGGVMSKPAADLFYPSHSHDPSTCRPFLGRSRGSQPQ